MSKLEKDIGEEDFPSSEKMTIIDMDTSREDAARFIEDQLANLTDEAFEAKMKKTHYGAYELRHLMDFIYSGKPSNKKEEIVYGNKDRSSP